MTNEVAASYPLPTVMSLLFQKENPLPAGPALAAVVPLDPTVELDPGLGIVVIQFRNEAGDLVESIPSAQQLAAYAHGTSSQPPPIPPGGHVAPSSNAQSPGTSVHPQSSSQQ